MHVALLAAEQLGGYQVALAVLLSRRSDLLDVIKRLPLTANSMGKIFKHGLLAGTGALVCPTML